jgi:hypothetical protein
MAGEQDSGVMDRFGGRREGRSSPVGFSTAEGIGGGEEMAASRSRGHRWGPSSWGGCTLRRGAWGGSRRSDDGWSRLFVVAQLGRRRTAVVERSSRGRQ